MRNLKLSVSFASFWKRRFVRLYPAYLVAVGLTVGIAHVGHALVYETGFAFGLDILSLLTQTQNLTGAAWRICNGPLWSLALEEQLYLLYFPMLYLRRHWGWRLALAVVLAVNLVWILCSLRMSGDFCLGWLSAAPAYWFPWALGALAAESWVGFASIPRWTGPAMNGILLFAFGLCLPDPFEALAVSISFFFWLRFAVECESKTPTCPSKLSALIWLGTISYSVYLVHNPFSVAVKRLIMPLDLPPFFVLLVRLAAGILAGFAVYRLVERPTMKAARGISVPEAP